MPAITAFDAPAQAVADAIRRLHDDPGLREKYAEQGHRAAFEHYDWRRSGPEFVATLERFAGSR